MTTRTTDPLQWMADADCISVGGDLFFAEGRGDHYREAREICRNCPVRWECLDYAMDTMFDADGCIDAGSLGMWGGTTPAERRALARRGRSWSVPDFTERELAR